MPYDPDKPSTWDATDVVGVDEITRRIRVLTGRGSLAYVQRNLTRQHDFPAPIPWRINGGRGWRWGAVLDWFRATGRA